MNRLKLGMRLALMPYSGGRKTAPGAVVGATAVIPGPTPERTGGTAMLTHPHPPRIEARE